MSAALTPGKAWALLLGMVCIEAFATLMLKQSEGFRHLMPTLLALGGYLAVLFLFAHVLAAIPASLAYAVWTGLGTMLVVAAGWLYFGEALTLNRLAGIALITIGVILINRVAPAQHDG